MNLSLLAFASNILGTKHGESAMATISIHPIYIASRGGFPVHISGVRPLDHDCIVGEITTPGVGRAEAQWNLSGLMRGGTDDTNLNMQLAELVELSQLAQKLGAKP